MSRTHVAGFGLFSVTALPLAALMAVACGGSVAGPSTNTDTDAGAADATPVDPPDTSVPDAAPTVNPVYPAPHSAMPLVDNNGGRVLQNMKVVSITWASDDANMVSRLQKLDDTITQTPWWTAVSSEYCVKGGSPCIGPGVPGEHVVIKDAPPADGFVDSSQGAASTMQDWMKSQLANNPDFPDPTPDTLYAVYLPNGVNITLDGSQGCANGGFGAYHNSVDLTPKKGGAPVTAAYAITPRCGSKEATTTVSASHEFIEAATDPDVGQNNLTYYMQNQLWAFAGGEVGDLCVDFTGGNDKWQESSFVVQRSWSNQSAKAGHNPCVPIPQGEVYFQAAPRKQKVILKKVGDTAVLDIDAYSDGPMANWKVSAFDFAQFQQNTTYLGFSFDQTSVNNGSHIQLTVTLKKALPQYTIFGVVSKGGNNQQYYWPVLASPN